MYTLKYKVLSESGQVLLKRIRISLLVFMTLLFLSGLTAMPVITGLEWALQLVPGRTELYGFLLIIFQALLKIEEEAPYVFYGFDWLAFAHFILTILFIGPFRNPVQNKWVLQFGLIACVLVFPFAFIAGHFREIPFWWQLVDCSFGLFGFAILYYSYRLTLALEKSVDH